MKSAVIVFPASNCDRDAATAPDQATAAHSSENGVDSAAFDDLIDNNGTIEDLHATIDALMEGILK